MSQQQLTESTEKTKRRIYRREPRPDSARSFQGGPNPILQLQSTLGNQRVAQLIKDKRLTPEGRIIGFQPKLTVGAADDQYEQEADRVARQVVSMPDSVAMASVRQVPQVEGEAGQTHTLQSKPLPLSASITPFVQRLTGGEKEIEEEKNKEEDKDELLQAKFFNKSAALPLQRQTATEEKKTEPIQAKSAALLSGSFEAGDDVESRLSQSKGGGSPLPDPVRAYMEPRFGVDFSHVHVHTGSDSLQMNQAIGAQAFTHGSDIYFGAGRSPTNLELTAHELTHVVQQVGGTPLQTKKLDEAFQGQYNSRRSVGQRLLIHKVTHTASIGHKVLQRDGDKDKPAPNPGAEPTVSARWVAPFDLGVIDNTGDATGALVDIQRKLKEWKDVGYEAEISLVLSSIDRMLKSMYGIGRPLTVDEAFRLTGLGLFAYQADQNALKNFQQLIAAELDKYTGVAAQDALDAIAEKLHQLFMESESASKIADTTAALKKAKELTSKVSKYVGYAAKTKSVVKAAAKLDDLKKHIDGFKEKLSDATEVAELAESLLTLTGKIGEKPGAMQNDIAKFKAGFKIIDFAISKSNVPIIGQWWDGYIKPCTELALNKLSELDKMLDEQVRLNEARLDEWWRAAAGGMHAPSIVDSGLPGLLLQKYFRGGQPMLDFMWSQFRGGGSESVPPEVEDVFVKFRTQFNAGQEEDNQIETDTKWYKPSTWFGRTRSPNLLQWVARNKETVWAMLYGRLPHP